MLALPFTGNAWIDAGIALVAIALYGFHQWLTEKRLSRLLRAVDRLTEAIRIQGRTGSTTTSTLDDE